MRFHDARRSSFAPPKPARRPSSSEARVQIQVVDRPIKVGIVTPCFWKGGAEQWIKDICRHVKHPVELTDLVVLRSKDASIQEIRKAGASWRVRIGSGHVADLAENCDVVLTWGTDIALRWSPNTHARLVFACHFDASNAWNESLLRKSFRADAFVACSPEALKAIPKRFEKKTIVITNGVDTSRLKTELSKEQAKKSFGIDPRKSVLGFVGRTSHEKGPEISLAAIRQLPDSWTLLVAGDDRRNVWGSSKELDDRIVPLGFCSDVARLYRAMDVVIVPSAQEGFGYVIAEAWSAGVPVVSDLVGVAKLQPSFVTRIHAALHKNMTPHQQKTARVRMLRQDLAGAVMRAQKFDVAEPKEFVDRELSCDVFGQRWTDFLKSSVSWRES